ncbi:MAG TPA: alpha/beta hydrolase [Solirubrobacteraceae bacterium]|nr:alpha/beta hydrolase [Solirubrobacteraceae bacterium]
MPPSTASEPVAHVPVRRIDVRGLEVAYRRRGEGPPLLYMHGLGLSQRWLALYERLSRGCDVVVPDHPGFGDSAPAAWMRDFDDLVLHYAELADLLGLGAFHLVGHSFGGWVAAEFASFYPERVTSLTLVTPLGLRVPGEAPADLFRMGTEARLELMFNGRAEAFFGRGTDEERLERLLQDYADLTAFGRFAWNPRYDIRLDRRLGRIMSPALVIGAEEDRVLPASHIARYAELLPNARVAVVGERGTPTGHAVVAEEPEAVALLIETIMGGQ